jgi:hypothetical protein
MATGLARHVLTSVITMVVIVSVRGGDRGCTMVVIVNVMCGDHGCTIGGDHGCHLVVIMNVKTWLVWDGPKRRIWFNSVLAREPHFSLGSIVFDHDSEAFHALHGRLHGPLVQTC